MAGTSFYMFRFRFRTEMFSELSAVFLVGQAFVCFVLIGCALYAVLGSLMKQTFNGNVNEYNGCISLRYNSLFISLPLSTKGHKTTTWNSFILHIPENVNYATASFHNLFFEFWGCLTYSV